MKDIRKVVDPCEFRVEFREEILIKINILNRVANRIRKIKKIFNE